jgi:molybdate transport system substrate-binding protein
MKKIVSAVISLMLLSTNCYADQITIATAANFYSTLRQITKQFEKQTNNKVTIISGSTGKLYAQIIHGAPYDIFLAADVKRPVMLEKERYGVHGTRFTYAYGQLALYSPNINDAQSSKNNKIYTLALANPKLAPYGLAAKQALPKMEILKDKNTQFIIAENINQTYNYIDSKSADLGFVSLATIKNSKNTINPSTYYLVPQSYYDPIEQQVILLARAKGNKTAQDFLTFLNSNKIKHLISKNGYKSSLNE